MDSLKKITAFYFKPFLIIQLINILFYFLLGSFMEEYEGFFSVISQGTYTLPETNGWSPDTHFMLFYIYTWLSDFSGDFNVFGAITFLNSWFSLTFLGLVLFRILKVQLTYSNLFLFSLLYGIIALNNLINLNSVRHAFIYTAAVIGYIESRRFESCQIKLPEWIILSAILVFASLIRFEAVLLFSILYILILIIYKRFSKIALVPFCIGLFVYTCYNITNVVLSSEAKKVLMFKEREIFDRYNIEFDKLSPIQQLDVEAITDYCITDKEHFSLAFYDSISRKNSKKGMFSSLNGLSLTSFVITLITSSKAFYAARYFFIFYLLSGFVLLLLNRKSTNKLYFRLFLLLLLFPFLLCLYSIVPLRFLIPFLSISGCLNILLILKERYKTNILMFGCFVIFSLMFFDEIQSKRVKVEKAGEFNEFSKKLEILGKQQEKFKPIVINSVYPVNYFPVKPFDRLIKQHAVFLNFYLFSADDYQVNTWKKLCNCNTFSLKEKIDYVVENKNLFLIDDKAFFFLKNYFLKKYNLNLERNLIQKFDKNLNACHLKYVH